MKYHYTYMLTVNMDTPKELFYIGVRSSTTTPEEDIRYMGSSRLVNHLILNHLKFNKQILNTYESRCQANQDEQALLDEFDCIQKINCLNLRSYRSGYQTNNALRKIQNIKDRYPDVMIDKPWRPVYQYLTAEDWLYYVHEGFRCFKFLNHPEELKEYYPSTGTRVYWPGRKDMLMSIRFHQPRYYVTDMSNLDGTPEEQICELLTNHLVAGQRVNVLAMAIELFKLQPYDQDLRNYIVSHIDKEHRYLINQIDR